ncbi:hypothetical protein [Rhodopseudomonas parapalustris]
MLDKVSGADLALLSTQALKTRLLQLVEGQDDKRLSEKLALLDGPLAPYVDELTRRNPYPRAEDQVAAVIGVWTPVWSTIPFHHALPGRIPAQSYQIFRDRGFYANVAHHAPGHQNALLHRLTPLGLACNLMLVQRFEVTGGRWLIENIGIELARGRRDKGLSIDDAEAWFDAVLAQTIDRSDTANATLGAPDLSGLDAASAKRLAKSFQAKPMMENIYLDDDLRLMRSQRDPAQRPSYTIGVRLR